MLHRIRSLVPSSAALAGALALSSIGCVDSASTPPVAAPIAQPVATATPDPAKPVVKDGVVPVREPASAPTLAERLKVAELEVSRFLDLPFPKPYETTIFPHREDFDSFAAKAWGMEKTQCWMVAAGVGDRFVVLDPAVWSTEACEHDAANAAHVDGILRHELTHVLHGQMNPTSDFTGMDPLGWFVEGLAVYVSGQLSSEHRGKDREAIDRGAIPADLESFWSGKYRYGISGSLVRYVDQHYGRATLLRLLPVTTNAEALELLGVTEAQLIADWQNSVSSAAPASAKANVVGDGSESRHSR